MQTQFKQTMLELDFWSYSFLVLPQQDLNQQHWCIAVPII